MNVENTLPETMEASLIAYANTTTKISDARLKVQVREAELMKKILETVETNGKPTFPNEVARESALIRWKAADAEWTRFNEALSTLELEKAIISAKIEGLKMNFKLHLLDKEKEIALIGVQPQQQ